MRSLEPAIVVFGPSTPWPNNDLLHQVRHQILTDHRLSSLRQAVEQLPDLWPDLVDTEPAFAATSGHELLKELSQWLETGILGSGPDGGSPHSNPQTQEREGSDPRTNAPIAPNTLLAPLTVLIHIVQYIRFLDRSGTCHGDIYQRHTQVQGFCIGFLAAAAVASSSDDSELDTRAASAFRLSACVGAFVDLQGLWSGPSAASSCFVVRRSDETAQGRLDEVLARFPKAYVSVLQDTSTVTVTAPTAVTPHLLQELSAVALAAKPIYLQGCFHSKIHERACDRLKALCEFQPLLQMPALGGSGSALRRNSTADILPTYEKLHGVVAEELLRERCDWDRTITSSLSNLPPSDDHSALVLGMMDCVPRALASKHGLQIVRAVDEGNITQTDQLSAPSLPHAGRTPRSTSTDPFVRDDSIAITGMACRFPGANSVDEFWQLLCDGTSMLSELPQGRFPTAGLRRTTDPDTKFWGNFLNDVDVFDHKFFKISSREAASMDPQQRLALQVAYEAMESSGYFDGHLEPSSIGCYLGVGSVDYQSNVDSHLPTAFSALGTLRAFISGKISHYFGWTGPSLTYDTACSSSLVAIHSACKALLTGECSSALAGGVNIITSPSLYQNLGGASFLSPSGASKSFDAAADGYCRGEGCGLVVLKRLSDAQAAGDSILGVIAGSAVNQGENSTPITVPDSNSQSALYRQVCSSAGISPHEVSYVEAHGTGTTRGDPVECESIRQVFGGADRDHSLRFGSVKGNIGHLEAASGAAALVKTVLMLQHGVVPPQANFNKLNPNIPPLEVDHMEISNANVPWEAKRRIACINNYGAAGSNAALLLRQSNDVSRPIPTSRQNTSSFEVRQPILISSHSAETLEANCRAFREYLTTIKHHNNGFLGELAFNVSHRQNQQHKHAFITNAQSISDLEAGLDSVATGKCDQTFERASAAPPTVLCFGGQVGNHIGLSKMVYENCTILQQHIDRCADECRVLGRGRIFPYIFQRESITDIVDLHCALFAVQYASAKSWIASGLHPDALVGHSFGQLTALCVSGILSLRDSLRFIIARAELIEKLWGAESGAMLSVEADELAVSKIVDTCPSVEIACYNGPTSFVLVGAEADISTVQDMLSSPSSDLGAVKSKQLNVTHGFHSRFVDPLLARLRDVASQLTFRPPQIHLETCSKGRSWSEPGPEPLAAHSREPVYFAEALQRLDARLGPSTWLEVGSASSITNMARKVLEPAGVSSKHSFLPIRLDESTGMDAVANATTALWRLGATAQYWLHHRSQRSHYRYLHLPPYQFAQSRHWLTYKELVEPDAVNAAPIEEDFSGLVRFSGYRDSSRCAAEFEINGASKDFIDGVSGHAVLGHGLCPASLYVEVAVRASAILAGNAPSPETLPCLEDLQILAPLRLDNSQALQLVLERPQASESRWAFSLTSNTASGSGQKTEHATGHVRLRSSSDADISANKRRYQRLTGLNQCQSLLHNPNAESMQGALIYRMFGAIVDYKNYYRGVKSVSASGNDVAGLVSLPRSDVMNDSLTGPLTLDNFLQVAGLHVNSIQDPGENNVYVCTAIRGLQLYEPMARTGTDGPTWLVYSTFESVHDKTLENDIFAFDQVTGSLVATILGAQFSKVSATSLRKVLAGNVAPSGSPSVNSQKPKAQPRPRTSHPTLKSSNKPTTEKVWSDLKQLLSSVADVPLSEIEGSRTLDELGIDSLMTSEVISEIKRSFSCDIPTQEFEALSNVSDIVAYLYARQSGSSVVEDDLSSASESVNSDSGSSVDAPSTPMSVDTTDYGDEVILALMKVVSENLDIPDNISHDLILRDAGLDSLLGMELQSDIQKATGVNVDLAQLNDDATFEDLVRIVRPPQTGRVPTSTTPNRVHLAPPAPAPSKSTEREPASLSDISTCFESMRGAYDDFSKDTKFAGFRSQVYPRQAELVTAYVVEALAELECPLASMEPGETIPPFTYIDKHQNVVPQIYGILEAAGLASSTPSGRVRTDLSVPMSPSHILHDRIVRDFPQHANEHRLLKVTASRLADCLSGKADPLQLMFGSKENRDLLGDVYTHAPMFAAGTLTLIRFLTKLLAESKAGSGPIRILEIGAGTGGTTKDLIRALTDLGVPFEYCFTDLSSSLVNAAKRTFSNCPFMEFAVLDLEKDPPSRFLSSFHIVISTNCVHATRDLVESTSNIHKMLRDDGVLCLLELTRNLYWFDLVFGLLEGWWRFEDGRRHALANEFMWNERLGMAGYNHVDWTQGETEESSQQRLIIACKSADEAGPSAADCLRKGSRPDALVQTIQFAEESNTLLCADIYYPPTAVQQADEVERRPVVLLIHGGGHVMLSRRDVRPAQIQLLLDRGFLPVSVDYRLCPEVPLRSGPMADVCTALQWARQTLPSLSLAHPYIRADGTTVLALGWSTGGTLAMSLAWTAPQRGIAPPNAILAFYCPTDYEDEFWTRPNVPLGSEEAAANLTYDPREGVHSAPITAYNVPPSTKKSPTGGWLAPEDSRSRIALHMNWRGQSLPILTGALALESMHKPSTSTTNLHENEDNNVRQTIFEQPPAPAIQEISPRAQIRQGAYRTPTFIIHGTEDDLIPWEQARDTYDELVTREIPAGFALVEDAIHLFDLKGGGKGSSDSEQNAVMNGMKFLMHWGGKHL